MPSAFISYRRLDSAALATLIAVRLNELHAIDAYVDTRNTDGGGPFPDRLRSGIEHSDVFVCLLGETTLESAWVQTEIEHAHNLRKTLIPVFQERYVAPSPPLSPHVEALLQSDGVQFLDVRNLYIDQAIAQLAQLIQNSAPRSGAIQQPVYRSGLNLALIIGVAVIVVAVLALIVLPSLNTPRPTLTPTTNLALNPSETVASTQPESTATPTITVTPAPTLTPTQTLEIAYVVQTLDFQATLEQATLNALSTSEWRATAYAVGTQTIIDQTATAAQWTNTPTPNITASIEAYRTQQAITATANFLVGLTATATFWTPTPTLTATPIPLGSPGNPVLHNADWTLVYQTFDGFEMALVPVGCFMMGSDNGEADEKPVNEQCFDQPFWIDRYEVTNQQYGSAGNFKGGDRPRESVTWFEARDFCVKRGARLSTEREWEYAARGPDNLVYPWGNEFVEDNAIYSSNSNSQTADVGSRPAGNSWVGASDLSGNILEWVSSIYQPYPYLADDGRERDGSSTDVPHVLRGGSWYHDGSLTLRASFRYWVDPDNKGSYYGFRCARSSK